MSKLIVARYCFCLCMFILSVLPGCATPTPMGGKYSPGLPAGITTVEAAKADLARLLEQRKNPMKIVYSGVRHFILVGNEQAIGNFYRDNPQIEKISYTDTMCLIDTLGVRVLDDRIDFPLQPLIYRDLPGFNIVVEDEALRVSDELMVRFGREFIADARRVADDLYFIQQNIGAPPNEKWAIFQQKAAQYRAMQEKPKLSEEQRRLVVQANSLNNNKEYAKAIAFYQQAIDMDPVSYPPAYFNMALLSAQIKRYKAAISFMKQYLELVPDAKDVRSAQDKIYEWELRMESYQQK